MHLILQENQEGIKNLAEEIEMGVDRLTAIALEHFLDMDWAEQSKIISVHYGNSSKRYPAHYNSSGKEHIAFLNSMRDENARQ